MIGLFEFKFLSTGFSPACCYLPILAIMLNGCMKVFLSLHCAMVSDGGLRSSGVSSKCGFPSCPFPGVINSLGTLSSDTSVFIWMVLMKIQYGKSLTHPRPWSYDCVRIIFIFRAEETRDLQEPMSLQPPFLSHLKLQVLIQKRAQWQ